MSKIGADCGEPPEEGTKVITVPWEVWWTHSERRDYRQSLFPANESIHRLKVILINPDGSPIPGRFHYVLGRASYQPCPEVVVRLPRQYPQPPVGDEEHVFPEFTGIVPSYAQPELHGNSYANPAEVQNYSRYIAQCLLAEDRGDWARYPRPPAWYDRPIFWETGIDFRRDAWGTVHNVTHYYDAWGFTLDNSARPHDDSAIPRLQTLAARALIPSYQGVPPRLSSIASFQPDSKLILQITAAHGPSRRRSTSGMYDYLGSASGDAWIRVAYYDERPLSAKSPTWSGKEYLTVYCLDTDHVRKVRCTPCVFWNQDTDIFEESRDLEACVDSIYDYFEHLNNWRFQSYDHVYQHWVHTAILPLCCWDVPYEMFVYPSTVRKLVKTQAFARGFLVRNHFRRWAMIIDRHIERARVAKALAEGGDGVGDDNADGEKEGEKDDVTKDALAGETAPLGSQLVVHPTDEVAAPPSPAVEMARPFLLPAIQQTYRADEPVRKKHVSPVHRQFHSFEHWDPDEYGCFFRYDDTDDDNQYWPFPQFANTDPYHNNVGKICVATNGNYPVAATCRICLGTGRLGDKCPCSKRHAASFVILSIDGFTVNPFYLSRICDTPIYKMYGEDVVTWPASDPPHYRMSGGEFMQLFCRLYQRKHLCEFEYARDVADSTNTDIRTRARRYLLHCIVRDCDPETFPGNQIANNIPQWRGWENSSLRLGYLFRYLRACLRGRVKRSRAMESKGSRVKRSEGWQEEDEERACNRQPTKSSRYI